jgi:hypothetical protein
MGDKQQQMAVNMKNMNMNINNINHQPFCFCWSPQPACALGIFWMMRTPFFPVLFPVNSPGCGTQTTSDATDVGEDGRIAWQTIARWLSAMNDGRWHMMDRDFGVSSRKFTFT